MKNHIYTIGIDIRTTNRELTDEQLKDLQTQFLKYINENYQAPDYLDYFSGQIIQQI